MGQQLAALSIWVDTSGPNWARDPEARLWGRVAKVAEEAGEAIAALIGATGQNPRKGVTHTLDDVRGELLDVAVTALAAIEHLSGNDGTSIEALAVKLDRLIERAGISTGSEAA
jgi:NTP pyrophosphatase (non-canonical NTP hydrolase)